MTKIHKKKANIFGKKVPVLLMALILVAGIGSAALLGYFGQITGSATVDQSVTLEDGSTEEVFSFDDSTFSAGESFTDLYTLETSTTVPAMVEFKTDQEEGDISTPDQYDEVEGINTSYSLVTTTMSKDDGSTTWNDDDTVELNVDGEGTANVMVPVNKEIHNLENIADGTSIDNTSDEAYWQFMVDLDPSDVDSNWAQVTSNGWLIYESEGEIVDSDDDLSEYDYGGTIVGVKANLWSDDSDASLSDTVQSITFEDETYNLDKDNKHKLDVTGESFTMPPLPEEQFDFQITNEFALDLVPSDYTVVSEVVPAE